MAKRACRGDILRTLAHASTYSGKTDAEPASWDPGCSTGNEEQQEASAAVVQPVGVTNLSRRTEQASATRTGGPEDDWARWRGRSCFCPPMLTLHLSSTTLTGSGILAV